jgi:hypothetical protein
VPLSYRVEKMRLSNDKTQLKMNDSLSLAGIPPEVFGYRLGNRSALDWVIDQYRVKSDKRSGITSDPNRPDDPEYIVRLVGQVVHVSLETVGIVAGLPEDFAAAGGQASAGPPWQHQFGHTIRNWDFEIAENPRPGQYRYLQFAWKAQSPQTKGITLRLAESHYGGYGFAAGSPRRRSGRPSSRRPVPHPGRGRSCALISGQWPRGLGASAASCSASTAARRWTRSENECTIRDAICSSITYVPFPKL